MKKKKEKKRIPPNNLKKKIGKSKIPSDWGKRKLEETQIKKIQFQSSKQKPRSNPRRMKERSRENAEKTHISSMNLAATMTLVIRSLCALKELRGKEGWL